MLRYQTADIFLVMNVRMDISVLLHGNQWQDHVWVILLLYMNAGGTVTKAVIHLAIHAWRAPVVAQLSPPGQKI